MKITKDTKLEFKIYTTQYPFSELLYCMQYREVKKGIEKLFNTWKDIKIFIPYIGLTNVIVENRSTLESFAYKCKKDPLKLQEYLNNQQLKYLNFINNESIII